MIGVRLVQGLAFASCFNGCATAVVDLVPPEKRAQGIGLFGISGSLAIAVGPYLGEALLVSWGFHAYFLLLVGFGIAGCLIGLTIAEPARKHIRGSSRGFFPTAVNEGYLSMMFLAAIFGSGFAAMNTFFPLHAKGLGIKAGLFFVCYGCSLVLIRVCCGQLADRFDRGKLIFACLLGFGALLVYTSRIDSLLQTTLLGVTFGIVQGLSYPAMMARMVDRSHDGNRAVVVTLFTGSFGVGINVSVLAWGFIANLEGLSFMFLVGGLMMFTVAAAWVVGSVLGAQPLEKSVAIENQRDSRAQ
jgi:predicted MFS family arabinose efflux permease